MSVSPSLSIATCLFTREERNAMYLPLEISSKETKETKIVEALLDSGASGKFIDQNFAKNMKIEQQDLEKPIKVYNVDGTQNKQGTIKKYVELNVEIHGRKQKQRLLVTGLGKQKIILGFTWLKEMNPIIDWRKGTLEWRERKLGEQTRTMEYYEYLQNLLKEPILKKIHTTQPVTLEDEEDQEKNLN